MKCDIDNTQSMNKDMATDGEYLVQEADSNVPRHFKNMTISVELPVEYTKGLQLGERYYFIWPGGEMGSLHYSDGRHMPLILAAAHSNVALVCKELDLFPGMRINGVDKVTTDIDATNEKEIDWYYNKRRLPPPHLVSMADQVYAFFTLRWVESFFI